MSSAPKRNRTRRKKDNSQKRVEGFLEGSSKRVGCGVEIEFDHVIRFSAMFLVI